MPLSRYEFFCMKTNITKIGAALLAVGLCVCSAQVRAQATATVTTTRGAFTEFVPGSETVVVRTAPDTAPLSYVVTKQTTIVDQTGAPVAIQRIAPGSPLSVEYSTTDGRLVASRIVVQPPAVEQRTTTTTTTTRPLTHEEKEALEHREHRAKEALEHREKALEKAKDALDDDDDGH